MTVAEATNLVLSIVAAAGVVALAVVAAARPVLKAITEARAELADNTKLTQAAKAAASNAEQTSNGRLTEQIKLNQNLQAELYRLHRLYDALEMDPAGAKALADAQHRLDSLRSMRPGAEQEGGAQ